MKNKIIILLILIGIMMTGVSFTSIVTKEPIEASESNIPLSNREIESKEQKNKKEKAKWYSIYSKYGLVYDKAKDRFFYNGELVRFFVDKLDKEGYCNSFSYTDGTVDLRGIRNEKYELIGVEPVSQEEYDKRTAKIKASFKNMSDKIQENIGGDLNSDGITTEIGDSNYADDSLSAYKEYGVSYDKEMKVWMYKDKPIKFFYDKDYITLKDYSEAALKNGISLKVIRDTNGKFEKLVEVNE